MILQCNFSNFVWTMVSQTNLYSDATLMIREQSRAQPRPSVPETERVESALSSLHDCCIEIRDDYSSDGKPGKNKPKKGKSTRQKIDTNHSECTLIKFGPIWSPHLQIMVMTSTNEFSGIAGSEGKSTKKYWICQSTWDGTAQMFFCEGDCGIWYHPPCLNISPKEAEKIAKSNIKWVCNYCKEEK